MTSKQTVKQSYPEAFCIYQNTVDPHYVVYNHGRINEGGYVEIGRGKTSGAAWKAAVKSS